MNLEFLHAVTDGQSLTEEQAERAMQALLAGESTPVVASAFLTALRMKGETIDELTGFARAMRAAAAPLEIEARLRPLLDTCGTGGNRIASFNISTISAFVVAGAGVRVAKHGNRAISGRCGSADVLEALGVRTSVQPENAARAIREAGVAFLFAPVFHRATRHVQPVRLELRMRTAFNYLGVLTNPARAEFQVAGTWSEEAAEKIAGALARLGVRRGFVVHGSDGLGEVTITGPTTVFSICNGRVERSAVNPEDFGFERRGAADIRGGDAGFNRAIAESVLSGQRSAARDVVLLNAAMALRAAGMSDELERAAESLDSGAAMAALNALRAIT